MKYELTDENVKVLKVALENLSVKGGAEVKLWQEAFNALTLPTESKPDTKKESK